MKHHGNYNTIQNPEEMITLLGSNYENSEEAKIFFNNQIQKTRKKHGNTKRHLEKKKLKNGRK